MGGSGPPRPAVSPEAASPRWRHGGAVERVVVGMRIVRNGTGSARVPGWKIMHGRRGAPGGGPVVHGGADRMRDSPGGTSTRIPPGSWASPLGWGSWPLGPTWLGSRWPTSAGKRHQPRFDDGPVPVGGNPMPCGEDGAAHAPVMRQCGGVRLLRAARRRTTAAEESCTIGTMRKD